jgi:cellulose synthase/poly-beta-1,6-N-acetylglucosamine synthase-like glycosyltransferase
MCSESLRARRRGCELVHCARPGDNTARLDPETVTDEPSVPLRRPRPHDDAALYEAVRAHWREAVRHAQPADHTPRPEPKTLPVKPSVPPRRPRPPNYAARRKVVPTRRPAGDVGRRARPVDATVRLWAGGIGPSVPLWRPGPPNGAALREAVTVGEANLWGLRIKRSAVAFGAVLLFVALVVLSGHPFGGDAQPAQPSVPSAGSDGSSPATGQPDPNRESGSAGKHPEGSSGGVLPPAQGVQSFSGDTEPGGQPMPTEQNKNRAPSWVQFLINGVLVVLSLGLFTVSSTTLWWMLHAWRSPDSLAATGFRRRSAGSPKSFSLLLPARHEQGVLGDTIDALARLDHPKYEVIVIIGHDDPETEYVARVAAARYPRIVRVVMDYHLPKNKPKALNTALRKCRGDIVGVFDAEDEVHPGLLRLVEARFEESGADVVQAGVQLMNVHTNWWSVRNCLEYYFWFRSRLHFHAEKRFIPLGGNTVFTRAELLREVHGWDPDCLAEDCEIGVRLSTRGALVAVAYDPKAVTREETPASIRALLKQRTRWDQGFLQVLRKGEWRKLPSRRQRWLARYTLAMPLLQAATGVLMPLSLVSMFLLKVPVPTALVTFLPLAPTLVTMAVESAALGEFGREFGIRIRVRDHARLLLGTVPYQLLLAVAAVRSVWRVFRGHGGWEKTTHTNAHRTSTAKPPVPA